MFNQFFEKPILNSPYLESTRHWELDKEGQPTQSVMRGRRRTEVSTPITRPKKREVTGLLVGYILANPLSGDGDGRGQLFEDYQSRVCGVQPTGSRLPHGERQEGSLCS
jgi:hypothetical protein